MPKMKKLYFNAYKNINTGNSPKLIRKIVKSLEAAKKRDSILKHVILVVDERKNQEKFPACR